MCEEAGGTAAVINMLLLQEIDGVIRVFPAVPDGVDGMPGQRRNIIMTITAFRQSTVRGRM